MLNNNLFLIIFYNFVIGAQLDYPGPVPEPGQPAGPLRHDGGGNPAAGGRPCGHGRPHCRHRRHGHRHRPQAQGEVPGLQGKENFLYKLYLKKKNLFRWPIGE